MGAILPLRPDQPARHGFSRISGDLVVPVALKE
jgi:hypothetical protein